ncbi:hypothetical protein MKI84_19345 [Ancylobacter sp. A5.8]|uniref:hypothetical protein n=1 Tax=Ancylobacter gelatini TaxID=2919920 RepID=UPI001F4D9DAE|nr:hypothetical protein [Ancylobacter gelatini]MCJ8145084.1 hypothetical protein [Ancylobacter gelatini]
MSKAPVWSSDRLQAMETSQLRQLLANARARGAEELALKCEAVLSERSPPKKTGATPARRKSGDVVSQFHFVCEGGRGVTSDGEGFFWTGSWIVPEEEVIKSMRAGAKLALHNSRSEASYRQGKILDYRKTPQDVIKKRNVGIEFLVAADDVALSWSGDGTGEKGYKWASDAQNNKLDER